MKKEEFKAHREAVKALLNSNFRATEVEQHVVATMNFLIQDYVKKFQKGNPQKKLGVKAQKKIHTIVLNRLRAMYGKWITVRIVNEKKWGWDTNLGQVYKTENGRIYGTDLYEDLFITTHALDRWEERNTLDNWENYDKGFKIKYHADPTALDRTLFLLKTAYQIGICNENPFYRYLNVNGGVFVIEILEGIMVIKTFLNYNMRMPPMTWYSSFDDDLFLKTEQLIMPDSEDEDILGKLNHKYELSFVYSILGIGH